MGTFRVEVTLKNIHESVRRQTLSLLVDTGATYTTLPRTVAESLGCSPIGTRRVLLANGREEEWPISLVLMTLESNTRSEEHTSELQSRPHLVCRLLLEKKKNTNKHAGRDRDTPVVAIARGRVS